LRSDCADRENENHPAAPYGTAPSGAVFFRHPSPRRRRRENESPPAVGKAAEEAEKPSAFPFGKTAGNFLRDSEKNDWEMSKKILYFYLLYCIMTLNRHPRAERKKQNAAAR